MEIPYSVIADYDIIVCFNYDEYIQNYLFSVLRFFEKNKRGFFYQPYGLTRDRCNTLENVFSDHTKRGEVMAYAVTCPGGLYSAGRDGALCNPTTTHRNSIMCGAQSNSLRPLSGKIDGLYNLMHRLLDTLRTYGTPAQGTRRF